ncbi:MAG: hypothetical protein WBZ36_03945 [Candidatus Nitrosopolaris sp.]
MVVPPEAKISVWGNASTQVAAATAYKNFRNVPPTHPPIIPRFYQISVMNIQHSDNIGQVPRESISGSN